MEKYLTKEGLNRVWNNIKVWISSRYQEKINGKGLSTNDYTTEEKTKLNSLSANAQLPIGGTSGQILSKTSNTDYDMQWSDNSGGGNVEVIFDNSILELTSSSTQEEIINAFGSVDSFKNKCTLVRNGNPIKLYINFANTGTTVIPSYVHAATDNTTRWIIEIDAIYYDIADIAQMHIIIMYYNSLFTIEKTLSIVMPAGGTIGQVLTKASLSDFDTEWTDVNNETVLLNEQIMSLTESSTQEEIINTVGGIDKFKSDVIKLSNHATCKIISEFMGMSLYIIQSLAYYEESSNKYVYALRADDNNMSSLILISYENETFSVIANNTELLVTTIDSASTDTQYPSSKCVYNAIEATKPVVFNASILELKETSTQEEIVNSIGSIEIFKTKCNLISNGRNVIIYDNLINSSKIYNPTYIFSIVDTSTNLWGINLSIIYYSINLKQIDLSISYDNTNFTVSKTTINL